MLRKEATPIGTKKFASKVRTKKLGKLTDLLGASPSGQEWVRVLIEQERGGRSGSKERREKLVILKGENEAGNRDICFMQILISHIVPKP